MGKFSQYRQGFKDEWKSDPLFHNWIESVKDDSLKAYCKCCRIILPAHYAGLTNHASCAKHCKNVLQNENKTSDLSTSLDLSKRGHGLAKQLCSRATASKQLQSSSESSKGPDEGVCTLELTVDDVTMQHSNERSKTFLRTNQQNSKVRVFKLKAGSRPLVTEKEKLNLKISEVEFSEATNSEISEFVGEALLSESSLIDRVFCKQEPNENILEGDTESERRGLPVQGQQSNARTDATDEADVQEEDEDPKVASASLPQQNSKKKLKMSDLFEQRVERYQKTWESDPNFQGWIAPADGDKLKARCLICNVLIKGNINCLMEHSVTAAHKANVTAASQFQQNGSRQPIGTVRVCQIPAVLKKKDFKLHHNGQDTVCCKQEVTEDVAENENVEVTNELSEAEKTGIGSGQVLDGGMMLNASFWHLQQEAGCLEDSSSKKRQGNDEDDQAQVKKYPQKYVMRWNNDPALRDWVAPVPGNVYRAKCRWCRVELRAHYKDLKHHAESTKHATSATMHDFYPEAYDSTEESNSAEEPLKAGPLKKLKTSDGSAEQQSKQNPCYFLSRSSWDRYKQKYRKAWELDPNFRGWIAPVEGDIFKARCLYCRVLIRAHHKDLKEHSKTTKHANNVAFGLPYNGTQLCDAGSVLPKPRMLKRKALARRQKKLARGLAPGPYLTDFGQGDSLLRPDETLTSVENLINLANLSCTSHSESTVTTLVFPNATQLDESVAAALPNNPKTLYRVKKISSAIGAGQTKKAKVLDDADTVDHVTRLVRKVTLWEFLKMKVERGGLGLRIPDMLSEFEALYEQIKRITDERLEPIDMENVCANSIPNPDSVMVLSSDRLAKLLDIAVGHYQIKDVPMGAGEAANFELVKKHGNESSTVSALDSALISVQSLESCIPSDGLQSGIFPVDHVGQPDVVLTAPELVFSSAEHVIQLQDADCLASTADSDSLVYTNTDGTLFIHVSGPGERQIPLNVIQSLFATKEEDNRIAHGTGNSAVIVP